MRPDTGSPGVAVDLAVRAARSLGVNPEGARLRREVSSSQVELPACSVFARVEPADRTAIAERCARSARFLANRGVLAVRLVEPERQPLIFPEGAVTLWHAVEILDRSPSVSTLAATARELHRATGGELSDDIQEVDVFSSIFSWLAQSEKALAPGDLRSLEEEARALAELWPLLAAQDPLGAGFVHGDFHRENLVLTPAGWTLLDLEECGVGPISWDLVPQLVAVRRYGAPASNWRDFCDAYGSEPSEWSGMGDLCRLYELAMTVWAVAHRHLSDELATEGELRLDSFLGRGGGIWTLR